MRLVLWVERDKFFALLLILLGQFTNGGRFTNSVNPYHQNNKRSLGFVVIGDHLWQRLLHGSEHGSELLFKQFVKRVAVFQL